MPAYLFTYHAYRSWNADNPRGFVQRGKGIQPPNHNLARAYDAVAGAAPMIFGREHQRILIWDAMFLMRIETRSHGSLPRQLTR